MIDAIDQADEDAWKRATRADQKREVPFSSRDYYGQKWLRRTSQNSDLSTTSSDSETSKLIVKKEFKPAFNRQKYTRNGCQDEYFLQAGQESALGLKNLAKRIFSSESNKQSAAKK